MRSHETFSPGTGRRAPARAWVHSDAPTLDLSGSWRFRLSNTADPGDEPWREGYDDSAWDTLPVPSHWGLHPEGRSTPPIYTNVKYPFPIQPPQVPDANPTGDHRRTFALTDEWPGLAHGGRTFLRLDGAESTAQVWLNGTFVGSTSGSRLVQEFDVTDMLRAGENQITIRVIQFSVGSYIEDQDQWWLPGLFREVALLARPEGSLDDVWLRTDFDHETGHGQLTPDIRADAAAYPITVRVDELGLEEVWQSPVDVAPISVANVEPWSADSPRLYRAEVESTGEAVSVSVGFRTVRVDGQRVLVNGRPLRLRGVNRHEIDAREGRVFDRERAREDLLIMKRHHVDAIRTAHYPPHPELLELTDELGFWVMDECDLETHGFTVQGWEDNPGDDPRWREILLDRAERFLERDKNHASVVFWSLGNESSTGQNLAAMAQWIRRRDHSRPIHYEGDHAGAYTDIYSRMYPTLEEIDLFFSGRGPVAASQHPAGKITAAEAARVRQMPYVLCEYLHAMGTGAGGGAEYEERIRQNPGHLGGFVWEWRDHALLDAEGNLAYGGDFGEELHDGNFVCDGLVLADSTPTSGLLDWAANVAPVGTWREGEQVTIKNDHHASNVDLDIVARIERDGTLVTEERFPSGPVPAGEQRAVRLPRQLLDALSHASSGDAWLTFELQSREDRPWAPAGWVLSRSQERLATPAPWEPSLGELSPSIVDDEIHLGEARFNALTGDLISLGSVSITGPVPELWRAPTDNDEGHGAFDYEVFPPESSLATARTGPSSGDRWRATGLHRLHRRVLAVELKADDLMVRYRTAPAASSVAIETELRYQWRGEALYCYASVTPIGRWTHAWPRLALRFELPAGAEQVSWFGTGPGESYPDMMAGVYTGTFTADARDLPSRQIHPQESGHRSDLRSLTLESAEQPALVLDVDPRDPLPGFTLSPWTSQQLAQATHHHLLPESNVSYLYLDLAQHGLGSRSCGPGVRPEAILSPRAMSVAFTLRTTE